MHKKERVKAVIHNEKPDFIPSGFWYHFPKEKHFGREAVQAHVDFLADTDVDILKIMNEHLYTVENPPQKAEDWYSLESLDITSNLFKQQMDIVKEVLDRVGDSVYTLVTVHGVFASAFHALGLPDERFADGNPVEKHLTENPEAVAQGMLAIADSMIAYAQACADAGVDGIYYAALGAESYRAFPIETFEQAVKPADLRVLNAVERMQADSFVHICKDRLNFTPYRDYPGDVFNWAIHENDLSLKDGFSFFNRPILGGMDDRSGPLVDGSREEIEQNVRNILKEKAEMPFILGADCTLPTDLPAKNIRTAVEAVRKLGTD